MTDGQYKFSIGLDSKQLELDVAQAKKAFDSLVKQAQQAGAKIDNIPNPFENIGKSAPQVAQATQQFNGLNMATQQLVRELPAASMGLNTFFLAISNNLPVFADQVKNLRQQGTSAAGVLKGIGSALFSWQTALVLGVTALSMYGKEIGAWISSLFKGKETVDALKDAQNGLNEEIAKNGLGIGKEIGKYESLRREFEAINGDLKEQERFVRDNQSAFDDLGVSVNSVVDAEAFFSGEGTEAFLTALRLRAEALAAQKLAVEQYEKAIIAETNKANAEIELQSIPQYTTQDKATSGGAYAPMSYGGSQLINSDYTSKKEEIENLDAEAKSARSVADAYFDMHDAKMKASGDALKGANIKQNDQQTQAELRAAELRAKELAKIKIKLRKDADQAEIDAMADGTDKKIAQIKHDYELRKQEIERQKADLIAKQGKPLSAEQQGAFDALHKGNKVQATEEWEAYVEAQVEAAGVALRAKEEALKAEETVWNEYLIQYGNFQEKIKATTEKYATEIANAKSVGERMSLEAERDILLAEYEVEAEGYVKELVGKTTTQLNKMLEELTAQVKAKEDAFQALDSTTGDDAEKLRKEIAKLKAQIAALKNRLGEANDAISNDNWAEAINLFQNIGNSATEAAEGISEFDENLGFALKGIAQLASLSVDMIGALQGVQEAFKKTGEAASAMDKASAILAIISVVIKAVSGIFNIMNSNYEATRNATIAAYEYAQALEKIANVELRESFSSIFGVDEFGKFTALLNETQKQLENIDKIKSDYIARVTTHPFFSTRDQEANMYVLANNNWDPEVLYADMRSQWQAFWGTGKDKEIRANLSEFYEDGILNVDKLKAWYEQYGEYLSDAQNDLVKSLIESGELYEENMAEINSYMQSIFGELGASITDSLVGAFKNGTDAAEAMGNAVSNVLERIATDMAHAAFIQPLMEQAQDGIDALNKQRSEGGLNDEEYMRELMGITSTLMGNAKNAGEDMSVYLDTMRQMAKEMGIDVFESDSAKNSTYAKGFQTMSQETGSELNGRFTDIQGQTHRIAEAVEFMKGLQGQHTQHMQSVSNTLASIHNDTSLIAEHTKALARMDANLDAMRRAIDNGAI